MDCDSDNDEGEKPTTDENGNPIENAPNSNKKEKRGRKKLVEGDTPKKKKVPKEPKIKQVKPPKEPKMLLTTKKFESAKANYIANVRDRILSDFMFMGLEPGLKNLFLENIENTMQPYIQILFEDLMKKKKSTPSVKTSTAFDSATQVSENPEIKMEVEPHSYEPQDYTLQNSFASPIPHENSMSNPIQSMEFFTPENNSMHLNNYYNNQPTTFSRSFGYDMQMPYSTPLYHENSTENLFYRDYQHNSQSTRENTNTLPFENSNSIMINDAIPNSSDFSKQSLSKDHDNQSVSTTPDTNVKIHNLLSSKQSEESNQKVEHSFASPPSDNPYKNFSNLINSENGKAVLTNGVRLELYTSEKAWKTATTYTRNMLYSFIGTMKDIMEEKLRDWTVLRHFILRAQESNNKLETSEEYAKYLQPCNEIL